MDLYITPRKTFCGINMGGDKSNPAVQEGDPAEWEQGFDPVTKMPSRE